jgi:dTDP-L-rhamnose 4-epimerase
LNIKGKVEFINGDVRKTDDWEKAVAGVDVIVHLAAERVRDSRCMKSIGTVTLMWAYGEDARLPHQQEARVTKCVIASSRAVYGEGKYECASCGSCIRMNAALMI